MITNIAKSINFTPTSFSPYPQPYLVKKYDHFCSFIHRASTFFLNLTLKIKQFSLSFFKSLLKGTFPISGNPPPINIKKVTVTKLPSAIVGLIMTNLTIQERHHFLYCNKALKTGAESENQRINTSIQAIIDILNEIDAAKYSKKTSQLDALKLDKQLSSILLSKEEKLNIANQKTIYILDDIWATDSLIQNNQNIALIMVSSFPYNASFLPTELRCDEEFAFKAVSKNGTVFKYLSDDLKRNKKLQMIAVKQNPQALNDIPMELRDRDLVLVAVTNNGKTFTLAPPEMKNDIAIVEAAVSQNGNILKEVSEELQDNSIIVMKALKGTGRALRYASPRLKNDTAIVLTAVTQDPLALQFASAKIKENLEIVLRAVTQNGLALKHAAPLAADWEIVFEAVKSNGLALEYAHETLRNNIEIVSLAIENNGWALKFASKKLQDYKKLVLKAINCFPGSLRWASIQLKDDIDVVTAAVKKSGQALEYASDRLRNNWLVVQAALVQDATAFKYASENLKNEPELNILANELYLRQLSIVGKTKHI